MTDDALRSDRIDTDIEARAFTAFAMERGWGDGLPMVAPTEDLVGAYVAAAGREGTHVVARLPPSGADCTVELVAINAVMAGAPETSMPLLCAAVEAMADPAFDLAGINATTASVVPAVVVNGPIRNRLGIPCRESALGGSAGPAPGIGRALRLVMRNVAGQVAGLTSQSVFGQPGRVTGIVVGEWEERSPWAPLAERRGVAGDAVSAFGVLGTSNIVDTTARTGEELCQVIGRSLGYMGNNNFCRGSQFAHQLVAVNPVWANDVIARDIPSIDEANELIWRSASLRIEEFPKTLQPGLEETGRVSPDGKVYLMDSPEDLSVFVCGGLGNLHAAMLPGMSNLLPITRAVP